MERSSRSSQILEKEKVTCQGSPPRRGDIWDGPRSIIGTLKADTGGKHIQTEGIVCTKAQKHEWTSSYIYQEWRVGIGVGEDKAEKGCRPLGECRFEYFTFLSHKKILRQG